MAASRGVVLTEEHRDIIAAGQLSMSELAAELGIARQSLHVTFKRKGWPTTPVAAMPSLTSTAPTAGPPAPGSPATVPRARRRPASARSASPTASSLLTAPVVSPRAPAPPTTAIASAPVEDDTDLVEVARQELANVGLLVLARARDMLARTQPGPQGLKSIIASAEIADRLLRRAGIDLANPADAQAPRMVIAEMTAAECEAARAAAEAEHNDSFGAAEDDDELAEDVDEATPRQRAV